MKKREGDIDKMKMLKKMLCFIFSCVMLLCFLPQSAFVESASGGVVAAWQWVDENNYLIKQSNQWQLWCYPEKPLKRNHLDHLPKEITATLQDGTQCTLALTWNTNSVIPSDGTTNPTQTLTASLPQGYSLQSGADKLEVHLKKASNKNQAVLYIAGDSKAYWSHWQQWKTIDMIR